MRKEVQKERWNKLTEAFGGDPAKCVAGLVDELGLPNRLRGVGVPEQDLAGISDEFGEESGKALEILHVAY